MRPCRQFFFVVSFAFLSFRLSAQQVVDSYQVKIAGTNFPALNADGDGNVFVSGSFDQLNGQYSGRLLKLDANGKQVSTFHPVIADNMINYLRIRHDGKLLVSGSFTMMNGYAVNGLARLNADGTTDDTFHSAIAGGGRVELQSDGKILLISSSTLYRLNPDGSTDNTFQFENYLPDNSLIAVGPDDDIYFCSFSTVHKLKADGADDTSFSTGAGVNTGAIYSLTAQHDGKVLVGGFYTAYNGTPANSLVRINPDGTVDTGFNVGPGAQGDIYKITVRSNNNILIGGQFNSFGAAAASVVELKPDGTLQKIVGVVYINNVTSIEETSDKQIVIGGQFTSINGFARNGIAKFNADYTMNNAFDPLVSYINSNGRNLSVQQNGSIVLSGGNEFLGVFNGNSLVRQVIARETAWGTLDKSYNPAFPTGNSPVIAKQMIQADDKVVLSGYVQGFNKPNLIRINTNGTVDNSFAIGSGPTQNGLSNNAYVLQQHNNELYLGGYFDHFNGTLTSGFVCLNLDGSVKKTFSVFPAYTNFVDMGFQSDGKIIVAGDIPFSAGKQNVIRLNTDGSIDQAFNPITVDGYVMSIQIDSLDRIYVAGMYTNLNGAYVGNLARLSPDGQLDNSFDTHSGFNVSEGWITAIQILPHGNLAAGGYFTSFQSTPAPGFIILDPQGNRVDLPGVKFGNTSNVVSMTYRDGALYLNGRFYKADYTDVLAVAKIQIKPEVVPLAPQQLQVSLQAPGSFNIQWEDKSNNELAFIVERSTDNVHFDAIDTLASNVTYTIDPNRLPETQYFYRVNALNVQGPSLYSAVASFTWYPAPTGTLALSITQPMSTQVVLTWQGNVQWDDGFIVERSLTAESGYVALDTVSASTLTYTDVVPEATVYFYRVLAYNPGGRIPSNTVTMIIAGVEETQNNFSVYPVPAGETLFAKVAEVHANGQWRLISYSGQEFTITPHQTTDGVALDLTDVPQGVYILQYRDGTAVYHSKVVK